MQKLYKFHWDCGRNGDLDGVFIAEPEEIEALIGKEIYFGEVLGKHSEIHGTLEADDLEVLTDDQDFINKAFEYKLVIGFNPLDYWVCSNCGDPFPASGVCSKCVEEEK